MQNQRKPGSMGHDWSEAARSIDGRTRGRVRELAESVCLSGAVRPAFTHAVLELVRLHTADVMLARQEARMGHSWPGEERSASEEQHDLEWTRALRVLEETCREERRRA